MLYKDFTPAEWQKIIILPQLAALFVSLASPSGILSIVKEMLAASGHIASTIKQGSSNDLIRAAAADIQALLANRQQIEGLDISLDQTGIQDRCLNTCREVAALLEQKAPADAEGYKQWVYAVALESAKAAREGGFLGIGGIRVNIAEEDALYEIAGALAIRV